MWTAAVGEHRLLLFDLCLDNVSQIKNGLGYIKLRRTAAALKVLYFPSAESGAVS